MSDMVCSNACENIVVPLKNAERLGGHVVDDPLGVELLMLRKSELPLNFMQWN